MGNGAGKFKRNLAVHSADMQQYTAEPGVFTVAIGGDSDAARQHQARFQLVGR